MQNVAWITRRSLKTAKGRRAETGSKNRGYPEEKSFSVPEMKSAHEPKGEAKVGRGGRRSLSSLSTSVNSSPRDSVLQGHRQNELATFFFFFFLKTSFSFQLWRDGNLPVPDTPRETRAVERYWLFLEAVHGAAGELNPVLGRE